MNQELYFATHFDEYTDMDESSFELENNLESYSTDNKAKSIEERVKIKKSIEDIMERRRLKEETDFI